MEKPGHPLIPKKPRKKPGHPLILVIKTDVSLPNELKFIGVHAFHISSGLLFPSQRGSGVRPVFISYTT